MVALSDRWAKYLVQQPETGMDYQVVTIATKDGRKYPQSVISGGVVTRVRGYEAIPFAETDISDIVVTHEKWDWSAEWPAR